MPYDHSRVLAVLGPTNTGKTHFAVDRMLAHQSGLIGFPLRLLAREIYDRIVAIKGRDQVALITGEEKIQPKSARYWVATVEAMPEDLDVSFLAVDEIQLAADRERGHVFTDRLLRSRGRDETMFLGADTIRPLLKQLVPTAEIITRPRFSTLIYVPPEKVTRLPKRSAVVAFTARDVYAFAEVIRRHRGGAAVVLGSLSPRTRNAQVALYQEGEVDYLIATDAIGMGLNMDVNHVALASLVKFDGRETRELHSPEIGQIVGRAGRHMRDGTFGTTVDVGGLEPRLVEALEQHDFPALRELRWRNSDLEFATLERLIDSLDRLPPLPGLRRTGNALDHVSLKMLAGRRSIAERARSADRVRLLWTVCQIPDFRKTLTDAHLHLLDTVFGHLIDRGRLPADWMADQLARLETTDGDIDALTTRLSHVRTWTYVAHRSDWLEDAAHWQERARLLEDRLSDALHERLTQRFVDRRTQLLLKSLQAGGALGSVDPDGVIAIEGQAVGRIAGLQPILEHGRGDFERKALNSAARRVLGPELARRTQALTAAADADFAFGDRGAIVWTHNGSSAVVARLLAGAAPLAPRLEVQASSLLNRHALARIQTRLRAWLDHQLAVITGIFRDLESAELQANGRGIAFLLVEGQGNFATEEARMQMQGLTPADRQRLSRLGVRFGVRHVYLPAMLKGKVVQLRSRLFAAHRGIESLDVPPPGRVAMTAATLPPDYPAAIGFERLGRFALRIDIVERLAADLRARARMGAFELDRTQMALTGLGRPDLAEVVSALGYRQDDDGRFHRPKIKSARAARRPRQVAASGNHYSPFAALQRLKFEAP